MNMKIKWLKEQFNRLDLQGMIISNPINIKYMTDIDAEGLLLITKKENYYLTDGRYIEEVNRVLTIEDEIIVCNVAQLAAEDYKNFFMLCSNVGFEEEYVTYEKYKDFKIKYRIMNLIETEQIVENQRIIKDVVEIRKIQRACEITDECFKYIIAIIEKGMTEKEIALEIEKYFKLNGADDISFDPIVASGPNSSMPHALPTNRKIMSGDAILIDMGCKFEGYCSDMTRTVFMDSISDKMKTAYELVLDNQKTVLTKLRDGENIKETCNTVKDIFDQNGYDLIHSIGHGVGLGLHEKPYLSTTKDVILKENMVLTNEPGIYVPGEFGIRIEDTILVEKYGCQVLTKSDKNCVIIK